MITETMPLISVIVPAYNIVDCLEKCIRSITAQTYSKLEILLVNDGSTDSTGALCDKLATEDSRIRVFHKENGGSSSARNLGISQAKGEYLGFVDSDDHIEPDMYERLLRTALRCQAKIVQIGRDEVDEQGNRLPDICIPPCEETRYSDAEFLKELLMHRGDCSFCTKLVARGALGEHRFPMGVLNEDFRLLVEILPAAGEVISLPGYGYHVFYRIGSNTRKKDKEQFSRVYGDCVDNADMAQELVAASYPELKKVALRFGVFQRLEYLLHIPISRMNRENVQYRQIVSWLRKHWPESLINPFLTGKNKIYHTLFAIAPCGLRKLHRKLKNL